MDDELEVLEAEEEKLEIYHTLFGIILREGGRYRYFVIRVPSLQTTAVIKNDLSDGYGECYTLCENALTAQEADEILDLLKNRKHAAAGKALDQYLKTDETLCTNVGHVRLDDAVPDKWYDVWHDLKYDIMNDHMPRGYYERDIEQLSIW